MIFTDINECNAGNDCLPVVEECTNTPGGYTCDCKDGTTSCDGK